MLIDPKAKALLTAIEAAGQIDFDAVPLEFAREQVEAGYSRMKIPVKQVGSVRDLSFPGPETDIPVRIYTPEGDGPFPVIVFFHGGGWVFFRLDAYDPICSHLCTIAKCIVVSVDYRLSPESKFPAATEDCLQAAIYISKHCRDWNGNPERIFLAGDSAGGNLAAVTALRLRDEYTQSPIPIMGQILIYPVTDYYKPEKPSYVEFADGYGLTCGAMAWFWDKYLGNEHDSTNYLAAPLLASNLFRLPRALVIVSCCDPLRDEGIAYANRLSGAGVTVTLSVYDDMIHGFLSYLGILKQAKSAIEEIARWLSHYR